MVASVDYFLGDRVCFLAGMVDKNFKLLTIEPHDPAAEIHPDRAIPEKTGQITDAQAASRYIFFHARLHKLRRNFLQHGSNKMRIVYLQLLVIKPLVGQVEITPAQFVQ